MSATGRGAERRENDAYYTPGWVIEALVPEIVWGESPRILEPCAGDLGIVRRLEHVPGVGAVDWCEVEHGRDFFALDQRVGRYDFIVTNPPYKLAQAFVERSLDFANCVIMLLRLNFLASEKRRDFWQRHPPTALFVMTRRPSFTGKGTDATEYAWFVWDATGRQRRGLHWL